MFRFLSIIVSFLLLKVSFVSTVKDRLPAHGSSNKASFLCCHKQAAEDWSTGDASGSVSIEGNANSSSSEDIVEKKQRVVPVCPLNPVIVLKPLDKVAFSKQCMDPKRKRVRGGMDLSVLRISEVNIIEENRYVCKRHKPISSSQEEQDFLEPLAERKRKREENEAQAEAEKKAKESKEAIAEAKNKEKEEDKRTKAETNKKKAEGEKKAKEERDKLEKYDKSVKKSEKEAKKAQEESDKLAKKKEKEDRKAQEESDKLAKTREKEEHKRRKEVEVVKEKERRKAEVATKKEADRIGRVMDPLKVRADNKRANETNVPIDLNSAANYDANRYIVSSFHSFIYQEHSNSI